MYEQLPLDPKNSQKKYFFRLILLILLVAATTYLFKTYDVISYFKKQSAQPQQTQVEVRSIDERQVRESFFMARIASSILKNDRNISAARDLLVMAQDHIAEMHGEKIDNARTALTHDIAKLNIAQSLDTQSIQDKLATLDKLVAVLPLRYASNESHINAAPAASQTVASEQQNKWPQAVHSVITEAKTIVKVSKKPAENTPYSSSAVIEIKRAQFKLLIEQIRWAVFYKDVTVYERSIAKCQELLSEIFDINSESVRKFAMTLQELSHADLNAAVPNIQDSVNALEAILVR